MEKIKKLLAEYEIRFHDTDEILKRPSHLGVDIDALNKGEYNPSVANNEIYNRNGCVYDYGHWAVAKITKKPEKWVVERNEEHPMWKKFEELWNKKYNSCMSFHDDRVKYVLSNGTGTSQLINAIDRQFLTLDQWAEFFLPKVDFSIHNDYEFFFVKTKINRWLSKGKLTEGDCISFCLDNYEIYTKNRLVDSKNEIIEFRRPTEEEFNILYQYHPEYAPPKEGDYGLFWNHNTPFKWIGCFDRMNKDESKYLDDSSRLWNHFKPFSPELQEMIKKEIDNI